MTSVVSILADPFTNSKYDAIADNSAPGTAFAVTFSEMAALTLNMDAASTSLLTISVKAAGGSYCAAAFPDALTASEILQTGRAVIPRIALPLISSS